MKNKNLYTLYAVTLAILFLSSVFTACGKNDTSNSSQQKNNLSSSTASMSSMPASNTGTSKSGMPVPSISTASNSANAKNSTSKPGANNSNIENVKGFTPIENQCFLVNLNSWGNVKFISGKITGGSHIPTVFYLANESGDILYSFDDSPFPYNVDVSAISFKDINKDGLKDIVIIATDNFNSGKPIAAVWLQNANRKFTCDLNLYQSINKSGSNKDMKTVLNYLSTKF